MLNFWWKISMFWMSKIFEFLVKNVEQLIDKTDRTRSNSTLTSRIFLSQPRTGIHLHCWRKERVVFISKAGKQFSSFGWKYLSFLWKMLSKKFDKNYIFYKKCWAIDEKYRTFWCRKYSSFYWKMFSFLAFEPEYTPALDEKCSDFHYRKNILWKIRNFYNIYRSYGCRKCSSFLGKILSFYLSENCRALDQKCFDFNCKNN